MNIIKPSSDYSMGYPFAVICPELGILSETFIKRHITDLLPGKTTVITRRKDLDNRGIQFPYLLLGKSKRSLNCFYHGILYLLRLNKFSPVQIKVETFLKKQHVQIVLSEYLDASLKWLEVVKKSGIRFFTHAHGYDISSCLLDPIIRKKYLLLENADGIITMSKYSRKKLLEIGLSGKNIHIIPYGISVRDIPITRQSRDIIRCLAVGRMVAKKAPLLTLKAFQLAASHNSRLRLDYIGDGELFNQASQFIHDQSLDNIVTLHGEQTNLMVQEFMKKADIFLQHSLTDPLTGDEEGLPVAILEAMGNCLPVISTYHAGIPEAVIDGTCGYLVNEGDISKMADRIIKLSSDISVRNKMGLAAWDRAIKHFSWEKEKTRLLELMDLKKYLEET
jgi:colanic acid/amylovoran biosynthesis glycosyltransferase